MAEPTFIVDVNVGRLAKWLRVLGYDTLYIPDVDDDELLRRAMEEGRVALTKDKRILHRRVVTSGALRAICIAHDDLHSQLRQVVQALGLTAPQEFSRCIECNEPMRDVPKSAVADRLPPYVLRTQEEFMECPGCHKVFWRGTHWRNMRAELAKVRDGS